MRNHARLEGRFVGKVVKVALTKSISRRGVRFETGANFLGELVGLFRQVDSGAIDAISTEYEEVTTSHEQGVVLRLSEGDSEELFATRGRRENLSRGPIVACRADREQSKSQSLEKRARPKGRAVRTEERIFDADVFDEFPRSVGEEENRSPFEALARYELRAVHRSTKGQPLAPERAETRREIADLDVQMMRMKELTRGQRGAPRRATKV